MTFSATDAALEGFKITRGRPAALLAWAGILLVALLVSDALIIAVLGARLEAMGDFKSLATHPPQEAVKFLPAMLGGELIQIVVVLLLMGLIYASVDRAVLRPGEGGFAWLAFGADEARQVAVLFCYEVARTAAFLVGFLVAFVILEIPLGALGNPGMFVAFFFATLGGVAASVWVGVRLSLGPPATFDQRRFVLFGAWSLTKGQFWDLLGSYIIAWIFSLIVWLPVGYLGVLIANALPGPEPTLVPISLVAPVPTGFASLLNAKMVVNVVFGAFAGALALPLQIAPAAYAYREIARAAGAGGGVSTVA
jgi:hypothetical protein